jgi:hypothetical protein
VSVAEETAAGLVVPVLVPKFTLGAKLSQQKCGRQYNCPYGNRKEEKLTTLRR